MFWALPTGTLACEAGGVGAGELLGAAGAAPLGVAGGSCDGGLGAESGAAAAAASGAVAAGAAAAACGAGGGSAAACAAGGSGEVWVAGGSVGVGGSGVAGVADGAGVAAGAGSAAGAGAAGPVVEVVLDGVAAEESGVVGETAWSGETAPPPGSGVPVVSSARADAAAAPGRNKATAAARATSARLMPRSVGTRSAVR
jgi:hypothetical protein